MAKRRVKKRTHAGSKASGTRNASSKPGVRSPKSMVIRMGASEVGPSVSQLVNDVRVMMGPDTASRLKERRNNKLRDFTTMAGPLGVTHLLLFSRSTSGNTNMRLAITPRGPTFHFRVEKYSLCKDVYKSMKRPRSGGTEYLSAPLLVMNNFNTQSQDSSNGDNAQRPQVSKHLETLATSVFQSLFPPINPTTTPLKGIKRVLLLDRTPPSPDSDTASYTINLRHYAIETRTAKSVPKALRRLDAAQKLTHSTQKRKRNNLPNLGKLEDVSDFLLDPHAADGFTSGSESEPETDAEVEVTAQRVQKVTNRKREKEIADHHSTVERKGIKLHELGPRMRLRLTKVEEGCCNGKTMWHEHIHKSDEEQREMERNHEKMRLEKERRKAEQKANLERKKAERQTGGDENEAMEGLDDDMDDDEWNDEPMDDDVAMDSPNGREMDFSDDEMRRSDVDKHEKG